MIDRKDAPVFTRFRLWLRTFAKSGTAQSKLQRVHFIRPNLEALEERALLSASSVNPLSAFSVASASPSGGAAMSQMAPVVEQWGHLIETIQQDVIGMWKTIGQEIAHEISFIQQQWDHLLGINPSVQNPSLSNSATQSGSDWGSGSGSGSSSTATAGDQAPANGGRKAQPLVITSASGDRYEWNPGVGYNVVYGSGGGGGSGSATHIVTPNDGLASNPGNWYKNEQIQTIHTWLGETTTIPGNQAGDTVWLGWSGAGGAGLQPIEWNQSFVFSTLNLTGYTAEETIDADLELTGANNTGTSLSMDDNSNLYEYIEDGKTVKADKDQTITNMTLTGFPNGTYEIAGGTTRIAGNPGAGNPAFSERTGVQIKIDAGATLSDEGYNPLKFTNDGLAINVLGTMKVVYGTGTGLKLMDTDGYHNNLIDVNGGTLNYLGAGGVKDTFTVPVYVRGGGTFYVGVSAVAQKNGGQLIVQNLSGYTFPNGVKNSVYMAGASSSVQLALGDTLECDNDYYQADGTLKTMDTTTCTLQDGAQSGGTTTIAGGALIISEPTGGYGELDVNAKTLQFAGGLTVAINATQAGTRDLLKVSGATNLQAGSTLKVYVYNAPPNGGNSWVIIQDSQGNNITGDFAKPIQTSPQTNLNTGVDQGNKNQYLVSF